MTFLNFLKRSSSKDSEIKTLTILETKDYIESWSKKARNNISKELEEIKTSVEEEKNKAYESSQNLLKAELKNPNIPERAKNIMIGNREIYVKRIERLLETVSLPNSFNELPEFYDLFNNSLNNFTKETLKNYQILNEFFLSEMRDIDDNIKELIKLIKSMRDIVEESNILKANELKKGVKKIQQKIKLERNLQEKIKIKNQKVEEKNKNVKKEEYNLKILKDGKDHKQFYELVNKKKILIEKQENLEKELLQNFSAINRALKKYERLTLEQELVRSYLDNPFQTLLQDKELKIVDILIGMNKSLIEGKIELKDKKKDKTLEELNKLNYNYFKNFIERYDKLITEINPLILEQENMTIIKDIERQKTIIEQKKNKLDSTKNNIENLGVKLKKIDIEKLKNNLTEKMKQITNSEIIIKNNFS